MPGNEGANSNQGRSGVTSGQFIQSICVYCGSSEGSDRVYLDSAYRLGAILAANSITTVYGGGAIGSMGRLADGALDNGGKVVGVIPKFMQELKWGHSGLTELQIVEDMRERKHRMLLGSDAVVALPGGSGTLEELFEAITLKRLGIYLNPIVLVNVERFFEPLVRSFALCLHRCEFTRSSRPLWRDAYGFQHIFRTVRNSPHGRMALVHEPMLDTVLEEGDVAAMDFFTAPTITACSTASSSSVMIVGASCTLTSRGIRRAVGSSSSCARRFHLKPPHRSARITLCVRSDRIGSRVGGVPLLRLGGETRMRAVWSKVMAVVTVILWSGVGKG